MKIPKITINCSEVFGKDELENDADSQERAVKATWEGVYNAVKTGCQELAYWDDTPVVRPGFRSFMRYALHTSSCHNGYLQLSVMEIRNGEMIPTSHAEFDNFGDFLRRAMSFGQAEVNFI